MSLKLMSGVIQTPSASSQASDHDEEAGKLLANLLDYVKRCQVRYGGKTELATEFDHCVAGLCSALESVLLHGLRMKPHEAMKNSTLKQVSDIVSNSLTFNNDPQAFWPFIKFHLTKHEQERYSVLRHIWTDTGRGRAWIRSALNERSLERYFHSLLGNEELLHKYYEDWAILCDQEKSSMLSNMAAGLSPILFAISIDKPELNVGEKKSYSNISEPIIISNVSEPSAKKLDKKRKKVATQIISFDDDDESFGSYTSGSSDLQEKNIPVKMENEKEFEKLSNDSGSHKQVPMMEHQASDVTLTPVQQNEQIGELIPVSTEVNFIAESPESSDETLEIPMDIAAVLATVENKNKEEQDHLQKKIGCLIKENDNLRTQLRRYISAVQMLKNDSSSAHKAFADLSLNVDLQSSEPDYLIEAKIYENKLVQVAEMHGELMEFNEHLQKMLNQKEIILQKMKNELAEFRGPLPNDSLEESLETIGSVTICIPSAFLTGSGSEAHHVYQIYIRAGNDDWNIYRRYAQFYALHCELKKLDSVVGTFDFPPKKSIRNKDANLVENRRRRLQTYLRKILAHWSELSNCNSRYLLEQHLSFFRDQVVQSNNKNSAKKSGLSRRSNNDNHYTGL